MRQTLLFLVFCFLVITFGFSAGADELTETDVIDTQSAAPIPPYTLVRRSPEAYASAPVDKSLRMIGGHTFLRNNTSTFPFIAPYMNATLEGSTLTQSQAGLPSDISAVSLSPSFTGQFRVGIVGIELSAQLNETFGSNSFSAFVLGANVLYDLAGVVRVEAIRYSQWVLTPAIAFSTGSSIGFSPLNSATQAVTNPDQALAADLITRGYTHLVRPELLWAFSGIPMIGFTGELGYGLNYNSTSTPASSGAFRVGGTIDLNLNPNSNFRTYIPAGAVLFFTDDIYPGNSALNDPIIGVGLYEMVSSHFNFGVELSRILNATSSLSGLLSLTAFY